METAGGNRQSKTLGKVITTVALVLLLAGLAPGLIAPPVAHAAMNSTPNQGTYVTDGKVRTVAIVGGITYIGGDFHNVGPEGGGMTPRNHIAALDSTGALTTWNPNADDVVESIVVSGTTIYVGGWFHNIGTTPTARNHIAALDTSGAVTAWNPNANNYVYTLAVSGTTVYAGGYFANIGGQARNGIAALNMTNGNADATWNPNATGGAEICDILISGTTVYVGGGGFTNIGGQARNGIAALNMTNGNADAAWNPNANAYVITLAISGDGTAVYAGGYFTNIGGQARNRIAALNMTNGNATTWNPNANDVVRDITPSSSDVFIGGDFTTLAGGATTRNRIAALDVSTGAATAWNPNANNNIWEVYLSGTTVYAGGDFTTIGGAARNRFARFDSPTIASVLPTSGAQGQTMNVDIVGTDTAFGAGSTASFGADITVNSTTVTDATHATANITIGAGAAAGTRDVNVTTGGETPD
ncbi:MAG: hypothetical protein CVT63_08040, partial [Candidatus Anoxymicrobium japonicum]